MSNSIRQKIKDNRAYKNWKKELKIKNERCSKCATYLLPEEKQVHHTIELRILIEQAKLKFIDLGLRNRDVIKNIIIDVLKYQHDNNIGIIVCNDCHNKLHGRIINAPHNN